MKITHFKREWLKNLDVITEPMAKVELQVTSDVTEKARIRATEPGKSDKYIVNLKAIAVDKYNQLVALFKDREEVPIEETNGLFLTGSIWQNEGEPTPQLPMKGEKIFANIEYVENRKGESVLRVRNVGLQAAKQAPKFDYAGAFEAVEAPSSEVKQTAGSRS